jgi:hypothetical protein
VKRTSGDRFQRNITIPVRGARSIRVGTRHACSPIYIVAASGLIAGNEQEGQGETA